MLQFTCPVCGRTELIPTKGVELTWDSRRLDEEGQPLIWPYLNEAETTTEKYARCPHCVASGDKMKLEYVEGPVMQLVIKAASKHKITQELALYKLLTGEIDPNEAAES